ncbi:efflux RND transporter periplasmic adaptor subunit [Oleidesulfovibrio sp.]|uniref:efflux RND transporter periplasmic adaptor subunit n=1 Tax=Oleidesulfovibrio sp. TaxID=2909707 RepID=UPI003A8B569C
MRKIILISLILICTAAVGGWFLLGGKKDHAVVITRTETLSTGKVREVLEATGIIKPEVGAIVKTGTRATGLIRRMYVRVGDAVKKDDLIAEIDDREQKASLNEAKANMNRAQAELRQIELSYPLRIDEAEAQLKAGRAEHRFAELSLDRTQQLVAQSLETQNKLDDAEQAATVARNTVRAREATLRRLKTEFQLERDKAREALQQAEANLESARIRMSYTTIYSPITGIVSQVTAQEGETVVAGLEVANLITVLDPDRLEMWIYVDETDVGKVTPGMVVEFRVDTYPDTTFTGTVDQIYPQPEVRDNIVYYQALVKLTPETSRRLRPEMTTQCSVIVKVKENVPALPNAALKWVDGEQTVFVQNADGTVRKAYPELGLRGLDVSEVLSGLQLGDKVAVGVDLGKASASKKRGGMR